MELRKYIPHLEIDYAVTEGPYEDDNGDGAYFAAGTHKLSGNKLELEVRRDVCVSMVKVLRAAQMSGPELVIADGQAAAVGLALRSPLVVEAGLSARVVQHEGGQLGIGSSCSWRGARGLARTRLAWTCWSARCPR